MNSKTTLYTALSLLATALAGYGQPTIQFAATSYSVAESDGFVGLIVQRLGDSTGAVGVDYTTMNGTATNGINYLAVTATLTFASGETNQTLVVPILDDGLARGNSTFRVILSNPSGGAVLGDGSRTNLGVTITDNDVGVQIQFATYTVSEDAGAVSVAVVRGDNGTNGVTVDLTTMNLTGMHGLDYEGITNRLAFAPQERLKYVSIPVLNNTVKQANRSFRLTLSNPAGLTLGAQKLATVAIVDNDQGLAFELSSHSISEDAGLVRLNVLRGTDDTNSAVTADVVSSDLSAADGREYVGLTNTLTFAPGQRLQQVAVPILNDGLKETNKSFRLTLNNPTGGVVLGTRTTTLITIVDNDPGVGFELSNYSVWENAGTAVVTVLRGNDLALRPITVDYATSNLTALASRDYQSISGTLSFGENETVKALVIPILRNELVANNTRFEVSLGNSTGNAALGRTSTVVTIQDAPEKGTFRAIAPAFDTALQIRGDGGVNVLSWAGGGRLQRGDYPGGPWQMLLNATNPYTFQSPLPTTYYRVTRPRPVSLYIPSTYDARTNLPLIILLHAYASTGAMDEEYFKLRPLADAQGFLYCYPDSAINQFGNYPWNATDAFGDPLGETGTDDVGFLRRLIEEIGMHFAVDRRRVYLVGWSNGGFMAHRMACDSADLLAGIASLAGMTYLDPNQCVPPQPVNILHIHATGDTLIPYAGGAVTADGAKMPAFPGALQTVRSWAGYNGASNPVTESAPSMRLDLDNPGPDTVVTRYTHAPPGGAVELWTINGGSHRPVLNTNNVSSEFSQRIIEWLLAHPKP